MDEKTIARFWAKVDKNGPVPAHLPELGPCWIWTGACTGPGYGVFWLNNANVSAHRASWELHHGPIGAGPGYHGICILHRCDNKACVRPDHLFRGNITDNNCDTIAKGRWRGGVPLGQRVWCAKLTAADVLAIRSQYSRGSSTHGTTALARAFGVCASTIASVVHRRLWRHVP